MMDIRGVVEPPGGYDSSPPSGGPRKRDASMDKLTRARRALEVADAANYSYKYDEDSALEALERNRDDIEDDHFDPSDLTVERYLVICTEYAREGPADWAIFCRTKKDALKEQTEYAQSGWASWLYDLDSDDYTKAKRERYPR